MPELTDEKIGQAYRDWKHVLDWAEGEPSVEDNFVEAQGVLDLISWGLHQYAMQLKWEFRCTWQDTEDPKRDWKDEDWLAEAKRRVGIECD